jgi:hypothetical protein
MDLNVSASVDDMPQGWDAQPNSEVIRFGREAWQRLGKHQTREDWFHVSKALALGRANAMKAAKTNRPLGSRYNSIFSAFLSANGFDTIDRGTRTRLFEIHEHQAAILTWVAQQPPTKQFRLNHPDSLLRAWRQATDPKSCAPKCETALPSSAVFNRASLEERRAFLANLDLLKLLEALPLRMRAELERRAGHKGRPPPSDDFINTLGKALRVALSAAVMKTEHGQAQAIAAVNQLNNLLRNAGHDLNEVEVVINPARLDPKFEQQQRAA